MDAVHEYLPAAELDVVDRWWRAANYLSVGQIYLLANPLLREPLLAEHVKPRLLGHWGTSPGLNLIYAHLNRAIIARHQRMLWIVGPGHGGPSAVANAWLEGTWSERYTSVSRDAEGMGLLFRQFSFPGGIPSHVAPEVPGSMHEGGELGYALVHAFGAAFDNPGPGRRLRGGRRGGRDRSTGGQLAFQQVPRPAPRWRSAADPAPQRLQDRQPHGAGADPRVRAAGPIPGLRLRTARGGRRRPGGGPPPDGRGARPLPRPHRPDPASSTRRRRHRACAMADDHPAYPEGLDRPGDGGRRRGGGDLAQPPGAPGQRPLRR
ncbi:MAG: hypothetical protein V9E89_00615 [Ilumatobacteraceae bacterium]